MKTKNNVSVSQIIATESRTNKPETIESRIYAELSGIELKPTKQSVRLSELSGKTANELKKFVSSIEGENVKIENENFVTLRNAAHDFILKLQAGEEKRLFLHNLWRVRKATDNFRITYQSEQTEDTKGNSETGLTPYRFTTYTAAGLRTCYNSYDIFRTEQSRIARKQAKQAKEEKLNNLANSFGLSPEQIAQLLALAK